MVIERAGAAEPGGEPAGVPVPAGEIVAVPGVIAALDAGVPWIREQAELDREFGLLLTACRTLLVGKQIPVDTLDGGGKAMLGLVSCARWTLGRTGLTPLGAYQDVVTGRSIRAEMCIAEGVMVARRERWEYATGVLYWILWITGAREDLPWPGWDVTHPPKAFLAA